MTGDADSGLPRVFEETATGALFLFSGSALSTFLSAICGIVVANLLGPELYGIYSLAFVIPGFLIVFTGLGVNAALTRYIAYYKSRGEDGRVALLIKRGLLFTTAESVLVFVVAYFLLGELTALLTNRPWLVELVRVILVLVVLQTAFNVASSILLGFGDAKGCSLVNITLQLFRAILAPLFVILGFSVPGALAGNAIAYVIGVVIGFFSISKHYKELNLNAGFNAYSLREDLVLMLGYGMPLYFASVLGSLNDTFRNTILAHSTPSDFVIGNFNLALRFTAMVTLLVTPVSSILFPAFSKLSGNSEDLKRMFTYSVKYSSLLVVPVSVFVILSSRELIIAVIRTTEYTLAPWYLSLLTLNYLYVGLGSAVLGSFFSGLGDPGVYLKSMLVYTGVFVPLSTALTFLLGVEGLIASIVMATGVSTLYGLGVAVRKYRVKLDYVGVSRIYLAALVSALPLLPLTVILQGPPVVKLAVNAVIYMLAYLTFAPMVKAVNGSDVEFMAGVFAKIKPLKPLVKVIADLENMLLELFG
ncbi:MAG: oligosaccharide flippase family protein [Desulfurococcaceae archaeon]